MVSLVNRFFKYNVQEYIEYCMNLDVSTLKCPCCNCYGEMIKHAYYSRTIIINGVKYSIKILRIKCKCCGKTHAVLPSFVVPYIQTSVNDCINIILDNTTINSTNYNEYYHIKHSMKDNWINRLISIGMRICDDIKEIIIECINYFKLSFLQIHQGDIFII